MGAALVPTSGKAEIHLQYECDLSCRNCNRMSFLSDAHTPPMTLADLDEFLAQARALGWWPNLLLIGGEPTMHPEFLEFCRVATEFTNEARQQGIGDPYVQLWSNQATPVTVRRALAAERMGGVSVVKETVKPHSMILTIEDIFVSPIDMGLGQRDHCWQHASEICGISVDSAGYTLCAMGGAVDGMLGIGFRTKVLADLFDPEKAAAMTDAMCGHCGHDIMNKGMADVISPEDWRQLVEVQPKWRGMRVSPTWAAAFDGRK